MNYPLVATLAIPFWYGASTATKLRWAFKRYTRFKPYLNLTATPTQLLGHGVHRFFFDETAIKVFGYFLLFASRCNQLCQQQRATKGAYFKLVDAWRNTYPRYVHTPIMQDNVMTHFFGRARLTCWLHATQTQRMRVQRIVSCHFYLCWQLFLLAMRIMDLLDLFFAEQREREEMVHDSFKFELYNLKDILTDLRNNKALIRDNLRFVILQINRVLFCTGSSLRGNADFILQGIERNLFRSIDLIQNSAEKARSFYHEISLWAWGKLREWKKEEQLKSASLPSPETYALWPEKISKRIQLVTVHSPQPSKYIPLTVQQPFVSKRDKNPLKDIPRVF